MTGPVVEATAEQIAAVCNPTGPWIVVPKIHNGRHTLWELIDTTAARADHGRSRARLGLVDDEHQAHAVAAVLNGADKVYRATLAGLDQASPF